MVSADEETGQTLIAGMGELHLRSFVIVCSASSKSALKQAVRTAYREAFGAACEGEGKSVRQTGGSGQYGHARIKIEPLERGAGRDC